MTLVLDASGVAEFLIGSPSGRAAADRVAADDVLHVPHLAVVEVASVLRGWVRGGHLSEHRASGAIDDLSALPAERWPVDPFLGRIWELRENMTAYDATYVALAEGLSAVLVTADRRLARAASQVGRCEVEIVEATTGR